MHYTNQVRSLLGTVTPPSDVLRDLARARGITDGCAVSSCDILHLAADAADRLAVEATANAEITGVEDISIDARRKIDVFAAMAGRLRARAEACEAEASGDSGPYVVPYREAYQAEATEW